MILSERINLLLKKWDFDHAKQLYDQHGEDDLLKFLFNGPYSEFLNEKLKTAIEDLSIKHPIVQAEVLQARNEERLTAKVDSSDQKVATLKQKGRISVLEEELGYPKELQELILKRKGLFAEANHARYILFKDGTTPEERKRLAFLIKSHFREIERIWGILNYWKEHKVLSPDLIQVITEEMSPLEMERRIRNLTSYISKAQSGKKKYKMSIEEMQSELSDLRRRINGLI